MELNIFIDELGEWWNLLEGNDMEELQEALKGKNSCTISDIDADFNCNLEGEILLDELEEIADKLHEIDDKDLDDMFKAVLEYLGAYSFDEAYDIVTNEECSLLSDINDDEALGYYLVDEGIMFDNVPEEVKNYLDYEAIGRDYRFNTSSCFTDYGFIELY